MADHAATATLFLGGLASIGFGVVLFVGATRKWRSLFDPDGNIWLSINVLLFFLPRNKRRPSRPFLLVLGLCLAFVGLAMTVYGLLWMIEEWQAVSS